MYFVHKLKFKYFSKIKCCWDYNKYIFISLCFFIGMEINGFFKRWISIGSLSFQPSDFKMLF